MTTLTLQDLSRTAQAELERQTQVQQGIDSAEPSSMRESVYGQSLAQPGRAEDRPDARALDRVQRSQSR